MAKLPASMKDPLPKAVFQTPNRSSTNRMLPERKRDKFPELFGAFDPDELTSREEPPIGVREEAEELFGHWLTWEHFGARVPPDPTRTGWLKFRLHPWTKRWTMFQWGPKNDKGDMGWWPTMVFQGPPKDGELPVDLAHMNHDGRYDNLKGKAGEYKIPRKEDFVQFAMMSDRSRNDTAWKQNSHDISDQDKKMAEADDQLAQYELDLCEYYADADCQRANRFFGGMQGLPFVPVTSLDALDKEKENRDYVVELRPNGDGTMRKVRWKKAWQPAGPSLPPYRVLTPSGQFETVVAELGPGMTQLTVDEWLDKNNYRVVSDEEEIILRRQREYEQALLKVKAR